MEKQRSITIWHDSRAYFSQIIINHANFTNILASIKRTVTAKQRGFLRRHRVAQNWRMHGRIFFFFWSATSVSILVSGVVELARYVKSVLKIKEGNNNNKNYETRDRVLVLWSTGWLRFSFIKIHSHFAIFTAHVHLGTELVRPTN